MSSRALRKAQQERDRLQLEKQHEANVLDASDLDDDVSAGATKPSAFAMLSGEGLADEDEQEDAVGDRSIGDIQSTDEEDVHRATPDASIITTPQSSTKRRKKKKKKKGRASAENDPLAAAKSRASPDAVMDEIDLALKSLATTSLSGPTSNPQNLADPAIAEMCDLLRIDTQHLQVANEMRRLFGRAAFDVDRDDQSPAPVRQRLAQGESATLAEAVAGRNSPGGAGLPAMIRRRNIFMPGKEEWPRATGGGLAMEIVERRSGGITEYSFVHNPQYQSAQRGFEILVMSMDPSQMVNHVRFNPYHVSTLLQVSEIAKQERDHTTSGDLLERALFSFGRAVHSTFAASLSQGKARLDFRRPENREFWLACWRYIGNIGMRATWRTAYEWARLLLSLDPDNDPYCVNLMIDQLALRARQPESLLNLSRSKFFAGRWSGLPNIQFSQSLAARMIDTNGTEGRSLLAKAIEKFPWIASRLFRELNIDKIPRGIWGASASSDLDILHCELYTIMAQDLWKLPETTKFLEAIAADTCSQSSTPTVNEQPITVNEARFVILTDKPALIGLLPRSITSTIDSMSDPLPPQDSIQSYESKVSYNHQTLGEDMDNRLPAEELLRSDPQQFIEEINTLQRFFELIIPGFSQPIDGANDNDSIRGDDAVLDVSEDVIEQAIANSNLSIPEMRACLNRLVGLRRVLISQPGQRVASETGDEVVMLENGLARATLRSRGITSGRRHGTSEPPSVDDDEALARRLMEEELEEGEEDGR